MKIFNRCKGAKSARSRLMELADIVYSLDKGEASMIPPMGDDDVACTIEVYGERIAFMSRRAAILYFTNAFYGASDPSEGERYLGIVKALRNGATKASDGISVKDAKPQATEEQVALRDELRADKRRYGALVALMSLKDCEISRRRFAAKWQYAIDKLAELEGNADFSVEDAQRQKRILNTLSSVKAGKGTIGESSECAVFDDRHILSKQNLTH